MDEPGQRRGPGSGEPPAGEPAGIRADLRLPSRDPRRWYRSRYRRPLWSPGPVAGDPLAGGRAEAGAGRRVVERLDDIGQIDRILRVEGAAGDAVWTISSSAATSLTTSAFSMAIASYGRWRHQLRHPVLVRGTTNTSIVR